ncbi:MAG: hypothetical protein GX902_12610 [Lentisphaerae bacterium]|nr:hypothetical protein [Lentisphaerota bacterium]
MQQQTTSLNKIPGIFPALVGLLNLFFILLIMIMISNSLVFWSGIKVETSLSLPTLTCLDLEAADKYILTIVSADELFFNDKRLQLEDLNNAFSSLLSSSGGRENTLDRQKPMIIVWADKRVTYETIAQVVDIARRNSLNIYLAANSPGKDISQQFSPRGTPP